MKHYYGSQTEAALTNFPFPLPSVSLDLVYAIVEIKKAAALTNTLTDNLDRDRMKAILQACDEIVNGSFDTEFITPSIQGGAGTSLHMNVNEVIASRATEILKEAGSKKQVHANDHVNMSQSTNDVNPSALRICLIRLCKKLTEELDHLASIFGERAEEFATVVKLGRTHMQDAVPTTLGSEFAAYKSVISRDIKRLNDVCSYLYDLNLGGTAIGNGINASEEYRAHIYEELEEITGIPVVPTVNMVAATGSTADFCHLSSVVTLIAGNLSKIATDIRFMASGPRGGINELTLEALQPGSSIMPGKVNPVLPESMNQISYFIAGKNLTVHMASENACLELSVMFPAIAEGLISSITLLTSGIKVFRKKCIATLKANQDVCKKHLEVSMAYATVFTPSLGYDKVSAAVKEAVSKGKTLREVLIGNKLITEKEFNTIIETI